jgi:3-deoxy-D-manno-octulosonic-acid transferase
MDRFDSDATFLKEAGQNAGSYVKGKAGATRKILSDVNL